MKIEWKNNLNNGLIIYNGYVLTYTNEVPATSCYTGQRDVRLSKTVHDI